MRFVLVVLLVPSNVASLLARVRMYPHVYPHIRAPSRMFFALCELCLPHCTMVPLNDSAGEAVPRASAGDGQQAGPDERLHAR